MEPTPNQMRQMLAQRGHLTSTPKKPNRAVGQRFDVSEPTGLAPKTPVDLEKHKGASMMVMPWDSTSRNVRVHSISGHELPESVTTHGGQDYARDLEHMAQGVAGASGNDIAKKIATREAIARMENERSGGTGQLLHMPITMGARAEDFSMTPTEILRQLVVRAGLSPQELARMDNEIRNHSIIKNKKRVKPFTKFVGLGHPDFERQITTGEGLDTTAGELRKAIVDRVGYLKANQKALDFNMEDVANAVTDPALRGVPKGYIGNTVIGSDPDFMTLTPSKNKAYDTNFSGKYLGTLGHSMPAETLFGERMGALSKEFANNPGPSLRNTVLGALEKRKEGTSQLLNNQTLDAYGKYLMARDKKLRTGSYAEGGEVQADEPGQDEMLAHVMLRGMSNLKDVGANEAPNMKVKHYAPPSGGPGFPVGGVDFQPDAQGQQMLPGQPGAQPGQPPAPGGPQGAPQGGPPPGAPGQPPAPAPAPGGPQSNILQMTRQGQAMAAMKATPPPGAPMPKMAKGGSATLSVEQMKQALGKFLEPSVVKNRMYHGTDRDFKAFAKNRAGNFVTPDPEFASDFAIDNASDPLNSHSGANVMPVHVQVKNPFDYDNPAHIKALKQHIAKKFPNNKGLQSTVDAITAESPVGNWMYMEDRDIQKAIKDLGHDAYYIGESGHKNLSLYNPNAIKSAIGNRGTYDTRNPDINMAAGGSIKDYIRITERKL
jgi:hypothetical protein